MTDDNHGANEVSTDETAPADPTADSNGEQRLVSTEVTARRTYLKTLGLAGLFGAAGLASTDTAAAKNRGESVETANHLTAVQAAQRFTETKLTASDATTGDQFGKSVSVSGDGTTALIGAPRDDEPSITGGAAYVYDLSGRSPSETQLIASDADFDFRDRFGRSVSVSGDGTTALVGAPRDDGIGSDSGAAYVYDLSGSSPTETKLAPSAVNYWDLFGWSVSVSGDGTTALVGAIGDSEAASFAGAAYVIDLSGGAPTETKLTANDAATNDAYGIDVSVSDDGTTALIGCTGDSAAGDASGAVYVYDLSGGAPTETKLTANDGATGDLFGSSVSVSGDGTTALVGAYGNDDTGSDSGSAYVYDLSGSAVTQTKLIASDTTAGDSFGESVSVSGDGTTALVGAVGNEDAGGGLGSAYVYDLTGSSLIETELTTSDVADAFGYGVAMNDDGTTALVGAFADDDADAGPYSNRGSAYVFTRHSADQPPMASFTYDPATPTVGEAVTFDATASSDDSAITSYTWEFGTGATATGQQVRHTFDSAGDYRVTLTVADDDGASDTEMKIVSVVTANQPPTVVFTYSPATPGVGEEVTFNASASSDPNGADTIASYEWEFGDGTTGTGQTTAHSYTAEGDYEVRLTVIDEAGASETATQRVEVVVFADPLVVKGESYLPQDLDGDSLYEDITGDGAVTKEDSRALNSIIKAHRKGAVTLTDAQVAALDFNGDGHLSSSDKGALKRSRKN